MNERKKQFEAIAWLNENSIIFGNVSFDEWLKYHDYTLDEVLECKNKLSQTEENEIERLLRKQAKFQDKLIKQFKIEGGKSFTEDPLTSDELKRIVIHDCILKTPMRQRRRTREKKRKEMKEKFSEE